MADLKLKVDDGSVTVDVTNKDDEVTGTFRFNPSDFDIVKRYEDVAKALDEMSVPDDATQDDFFAMTDEIKKQFDYLLNYNVSDSLFGKCNPLTLTKDGDFFCEKVIDGIADIINKTIDERIKKKTVKINRATSKYHK